MQELGKPAIENVQGVVFPENSREKRSSTAVVKKIFAQSVETLKPDLAQSILKEKKWRKRYPGLINRINAVAVKSTQAPLDIARIGLDTAYQTMRFIRDDEEMGLDQAMADFTAPLFHTGVINGSRHPVNSNIFCIPYKNRTLSGDNLLNQIDRWETQGIFESSFGQALRNVVTNSHWTNLSGQTFVLMGAGSEIAPFKVLLDLGATVVAIDLARPAIWERLIRIARHSPGKLVMPLSQPFTPDMNDGCLAAIAGADLACQAPEIRTWLLTMNQPLTIGTYAYADGAQHVRIAMAMDAVIKDIIAKRKNISIACLLTPSDSFVVPMDVVDASRSKIERDAERTFFPSLVRLLSMKKMFTPHNKTIVSSDNDRTYAVSDNIIVQQGPGYILAKNLQKWRALVAKSQGIKISANVAPATTTRSVFKNRLLAAGYAGLAHFKAEAFSSETTRAMMTAALINDLYDKKSPANADVPLAHPFELFINTANHGGLWRIAYKPRSVLAFSVCLGSVKALKKSLALTPKIRSTEEKNTGFITDNK